MILTHWLGMIQERLGRSRRRSARPAQRPVVARRRAGAKPSTPEWLESRVALVADFGDAPDTGAGTGPGNYQTLISDGGPSHVLDPSVVLGATVDSEADGQPTVSANGDDVNGTPDDENGVVNPLSDLVLTIGAAPTVTLRANVSGGTDATLYGWIDYDNDGNFENATERASITVPNLSINGLFTLTFPVVPTGFVGTTYARFRLSTDTAAANSTGAASDGEVEDYQVTITSTGTAEAKSGGVTNIASGTNGGPTLADDDEFGNALASLGDFDGDGVGDIVVGARGDDTGGTNRGAIYVQLLNVYGTVKSNTKIADSLNGGPALSNGDRFGSSIANLGDIDGDGVVDIAVGAYQDATGGTGRGAVYVLRLNADGTVKASTKIANSSGGGPALSDGDFFGSAVGGIGDLNGDGVPDLVVGAPGYDTVGTDRGAIFVLTLNSDGTAQGSVVVAQNLNGGPTTSDFDGFGSSVAGIGDVDGDGIVDLAVGSPGSDMGGTDRGRVHVLYLNTDGTVSSSSVIGSGTTGGPSLADGDFFGASLASGRGIVGVALGELLVGAHGDDGGGVDRGAVWKITAVNPAGSFTLSQKLAPTVFSPVPLDDFDEFGRSITTIFDIDGDGVVEVVAGAPRDDTGGSSRGAIYLLRLAALTQSATDITLSNNTVAENLPAGTVIGDLSAIDPNFGDTHTFSILGVTPRNVLLEIVGNQLITRQPLDFETLSSFSVSVRAIDQAFQVFDDLLTINVVDANDPPIDLTLTGGLAFDLVDGLSLVGTGVRTISETDPDDVLASTYTLVAGAGDTDNFRFDVLGEQLSFTGDVNYELQPSYTIRLRATDNNTGAFFEKAFTLRVQDTPEPGVSLITSVGGTDENPNFSNTANRTSGLADSRGGRTISTDGRYVLFSSEGRNVVAGMTLAAPTVESNLFLYDRLLDKTTLVSHTAAGMLEAGGFAGQQLGMSADGRFVAYTSFGQLHQGIPSGSAYANLYLWDRNTGENTLISHIFGNPNTPATRFIPARGTGAVYISDDGRFVAFEDGGINLVDGQTDSNGNSDVFLYDRLNDSIRLVSHAIGGPATTLGGGAIVQAISGDGLSIAFLTFSDAGDVISGATDNSLGPDLYLYDVVTGQRRLVNHLEGDPTQTSNEGLSSSFYPPTFSFDGSRLLYKNGSNNLVFGQTAGDPDAWYVYNAAVDTNTLITRSDANIVQPIAADFARISSNGQYVVFTSRQSGFTATDGGTTGDVNNDRDVYRYNLDDGQIALVTHASGSNTTPSNYAEESASISDDGRFVLFTIKPVAGRATFVNSTVTEHFPVFNSFLYDFDTNVPTLVSHRGNDATITANSSSLLSELSGDGSFVAWEFQGTNAYSDSGIRDFNRATDVVLFARSDASNVLVSKSGEPARSAMNEDGFAHLLPQQISTSDDGRYVAFASRATNIGGGIGYIDINGPIAYDVFLHDRQLNTTTLVSRSHVNASQAANDNSFHPVISGDGRFIAYLSNATDIDVNITTFNTGYDLFVFDRNTGINTLVSRASATAEGDLGLNLGINPDFLGTTFYDDPQRGTLEISRDGTYIAFASRATDLVSGFTDNNGTGSAGGLGNITGGTDLFVYEIDTGTIRLASGAAGSATSGGNNASYRPSISDNGKRVAFLSESTDLISGGTITASTVQAYVYDWDAGTTTLVSRTASLFGVSGNGTVKHVVIAGGGGHVAFTSTSTDHVGGQVDSNGAEDAFLYYVDGDVLTGASAGEIRLASAAAGTPTMTGNDFVDNFDQLGVSADGRYVAFLSRATDYTSGVSYPGGSVLRLFRRDFVDPGLLLVSHVAGDFLTAVSAGDTRRFAMDASGNGIAYLSDATELVLGGTYTSAENAYFWSRADDISTQAGSRLVSKLPDAQSLTTGDQPAQSIFIDRMAQSVFFTSHAAGLVRGDFNERGDLFALGLNTPPTTIGISNNFIIDGSLSGSRIASLETNDPGDTHTYTLEAGSGDDDNAKFSIVGNSLILNETPNLANQNLYFIRVRVTDSVGQTFESQFVIEVVASRTLPILGTAGNDTLEITLNGDSIQYVLNGTPFVEIPVASVSDFNVDLDAGTDSVTVTFGAGYDFGVPFVLSGVEAVSVYAASFVNDVLTAREDFGRVLLERSVVGINVDRTFLSWLPDTSGSLSFVGSGSSDVDQLTIHADVAPFFPTNTTTASGFKKYLFVGTDSDDTFTADFSSSTIEVGAPLIGVDVLQINGTSFINDLEFRGSAGADTLTATILSGSTYTGSVTVLGEGDVDTLVLNLAEDITPQFIVFSTESLEVYGENGGSVDEFFRVGGSTGISTFATLERSLSLVSPVFTNVIGFWEVDADSALLLDGRAGTERLEYGVANDAAAVLTTTASVNSAQYTGSYSGSGNRSVSIAPGFLTVKNLAATETLLRINTTTFTGPFELGGAPQTILQVDATANFTSDVRVLSNISGDTIAVTVTGGATASTTVPASTSNTNPATYTIDGTGANPLLFNLIVPGRAVPGGATSFTGLDEFTLNLGGDTTTVDVSTPNTSTLQIDPVNSGQLIQLASTTLVNIIGTSANETLLVGAGAAPVGGLNFGTIDLAGGTDSATATGGLVNAASILNVESVSGFAAAPFVINGSAGNDVFTATRISSIVQITNTTTSETFSFDPTLYPSVIINGLGGDDSFTLDLSIGSVLGLLTTLDSIETINVIGTAVTNEIFTVSDFGGIAGAVDVGYDQTAVPIVPQLRVLTGPTRTFNINASGGSDLVVVSATSTTTDRVLVTSTGGESVQLGSRFGSSTDRTLELTANNVVWSNTADGSVLYSTTQATDISDLRVEGGNTRVLIADDAQFNQIVTVSSLLTSDTVVVMPLTGSLPSAAVQWFPSRINTLVSVPTTGGGGTPVRVSVASDIDFVDLNGFTNVSVDWSASLAASTVTIDAANGESRVTSPDFGPKILFTGSTLSLLGSSFSDNVSVDSTASSVSFGSVDLIGGADRFEVFGANATVSSLSGVEDLHVTGSSAGLTLNSSPPVERLSIDGGRFTLNGPLMVTTAFQQLGSTSVIDGTEVLTVTGDFDWQAGRQGGAGRTTVASGTGTTASIGTVTLGDIRILELNGRMLDIGDGTNSVTATIESGAMFRGDGSWRVKSNALVTGAGTWEVSNLAEIIGFHGSGSAPRIEVPLAVFGGTIHAQFGLLELTGGGTLVDATLNTDAATQILLDGQYTVGGLGLTLQGNGSIVATATSLFGNLTGTPFITVDVSGANAYVELAGTNNLTGSHVVNSGTLYLAGSTAGGWTVQSGGRLIGNRFSQAGASAPTIIGTLTVNSGGVLIPTKGSLHFSNPVFTVGSLLLQPGSIFRIEDGVSSGIGTIRAATIVVDQATLEVDPFQLRDSIDYAILEDTSDPRDLSVSFANVPVGPVFLLSGVAYRLTESPVGSVVTFRRMPALFQVFVDATFSGLPDGTDPDGAGPLQSIGYDAFATITSALNAVADSGTIRIAAGTYAENLTVGKSVTLTGADPLNPSATTIDAGSGTGISSVVIGSVLQFNNLAVTNASQPLFVAGANFIAIQNSILSGTSPSLVDVPFVSISLVPGRNVGIVDVSATQVASGDTGVIQLGSIGNLEVFADGGAQTFRVAPSAAGTNIIVRTSGSSNGRDSLLVDVTGLPVPEYRDFGGEHGELAFGGMPTFFFHGFSTVDFLPPVTLSEAEPNNDAGTSQLVPLAIVTPQTAVVGDLATGTDVDRFRVDVAADHTLRVVVTSTGGGSQASQLQPRLGLFDAAGTLLQSVDATFHNGQWTAMLSYFAGVPATFIVAVTDFGDVNFDGTQGTGDGSAADSGNYSLRLESVLQEFVPIQPTATLTTGTGDGSVNVTVSASGTFETATFDPIGAIPAGSTTDLSDVAVRISGAAPRIFFLSEAARNAVLTVTPEGITSTFAVGPLRFTLLQSVLPVFDGRGVRTGSQLVQSYTVTNLSNIPLDYELIRFFDGNLKFDGSVNDGGGRLVQGNTEYLFETDTGGTEATATTFVGIAAQGGEAAVAGRYLIERSGELRFRIRSGDMLRDAVFRYSFFPDSNGDDFIDPGMEYGVGLALRDLYTGVGANESRVWTTRTFFGSGAPNDSINQPPALEDPDPRTELEDTVVDEVVPVADLETPLADLVFTITTDNPTLFPDGSLTIVFVGGEWRLRGGPAANLSGSANVTVSVTDQAGATATRVVPVTILPVNDAPVLATLSDVTRFPGNGITTLSLPVDASDIEQSPDTLQLSVTTDNPALFIPGGLRIVAAAPGESLGTLTIVQAAGAIGTATITVTVTDADGLSTSQSFVLTVLAPLTGEIVGTVFQDRGRDGLRDAPLNGDIGDPGLAGVQVYADVNDNGIRDDGEALVTTDANGNYRFTGVSLGTHLVRVLPGTGFSQTSPLANEGVTVIVTDDVAGNAVFGLTDDHGDLVGTGTDVPLSAGQITDFNGSIQTATDADVFRVIAPETGLLDIGVIADSALESDLDVVVRLYRIDGATRVLIDEDSVGGVIRTRLLQAAVQAGQVFEIEVTCFEGSLGAYTALVGSTPNTVDDFGDTFSSAPTIVVPPNTPTSQQGNVETGMDVDFFRFVPAASGLLQASVTGTFTKTAGLVLYGPDRRILQLGDPATGILSSNVIAGNTYFLAVVGPDGLVGSYSFSVNVLANDTGSDFDGATPVGLNVGNSIEAVGTIAAVGELDFYKFVSPVTGRGVVTLEDRDGVVDSTLDAFLVAFRVDNGTPVQIALNDDVASGNLDSRVTFDLIAGKTYFIRASGFGSSIGDYLLRGVLTAADDVGDIVADAKPFVVAPGAPATLAGTLTTGDVDVFQFTATITGTTAVNLTRTGGPNQPLDLRIVDGDLQEIRSGIQSGTAELVRTFETIAGRTYFIRVARGSELSTAAQTYRIDVSQVEAVIVEDTPVLDDRAARSLQRDVDESVAEGIAQTTSFRTGEQTGTVTADARINEILLEKFLNYFGGLEAFTEPVLFIWFDPIDFVVSDPGSRQVGFTDARGTVNQIGKGVSYSGNGATEFLVIPAAQAGSYALQLVGVGSSQYRFGANFISSSGVQSVTSTGTLLKGDATVVLDFNRKGTGEGGGGGNGGGGGRGGGGFAGIAQDVAAVLRPGTTLAFGSSGGGGGGGGGGRGAIGGDGLFSVADTPGGGGMGEPGQAKGVGGSGGGSGAGGLFRAVAKSLSEPFTAITGRRGMPSLSPASQKALASFWSAMGRRLVSLPSVPVENVPSFEDLVDWLQQPMDNNGEGKAADAPANPAPQNGEAPVRNAEAPGTDGKTTAIPPRGADEAWQRAGAEVRERMRKIAAAAKREAARSKEAKVRLDKAEQRSEQTALARAEVNRRLRAQGKVEAQVVTTAEANSGM
jgi:hypothetical protein